MIILLNTSLLPQPDPRKESPGTLTLLLYLTYSFPHKKVFLMSFLTKLRGNRMRRALKVHRTLLCNISVGPKKGLDLLM